MIAELRQYLLETWDLHIAAAIAFLCLALILLWCSAISLVLVPVIVVLGTFLSIFGMLWALQIAGGTIPW